jgi:solute carrier family 50 protein (sugar transporter)
MPFFQSFAPTDALPTGIALFGTIVVVGMVLSSAPLYVQAIRSGGEGLERVSVLPLVGQYLNFFAWSVYGIAISDRNVWGVNVICLVLALGYVALQLVYRGGGARADFARLFAAACAGSAALSGGLFLGLPPGGARSTALALVGMSYNIAMYGAPIAALRVALKTGDASALPTLLIAVSTLASLTWGTYAVLVGNLFVFIPNSLGSLMNLLQLAAVGYLYCVGVQDKKSGDEDKGAYAAVGAEEGLN